MFRVLALALLVSTAVGAPAIDAVYPNPVADGDRGEFVVLDVPRDTDLGAYTLSDGETTVALPNRTASGRVVLTAHPGAARNRTTGSVVRVDESLRLANGGETLVLRRNGTTVSRTTYEDAPEGELYVGGAWRPLGATDVRTLRVRDAFARGFVLPDAPGVVVDALRNATDRVLVAGYTFSSRRVARVLAAAVDRGVDVSVLVEGGPVGGVSTREARVLDALAAAGVTVRVLDGPHARYAFHHAKYAVADDRVLVTSENWKPSGTGGHATRGWGVVVRDPAAADHLAAVHVADSTWRDGVPWRTYRANETFRSATTATATYPSAFDPWTGRVDARVFVTPDSGHDRVLDVLRAANDTLLVQQIRVDDPRFLNATVDAARRGARVRVLVSGAWYVREENRRLVDRLRATARDEGLDLRARVLDPRSRFAYLHVKGVVTEDTVLVGSLNWNHESVVENREVVVALSGDGVTDYYARVFRADWRGGVWRFPVGLAAVVLLAVGVAGVVVSRRVSFSGSARTGAPRRAPRPPSSR